MARAILAAIVLFAVLSSLAQSPPADGKALFERRCTGCHALDRDKEGPRLQGVFGRKAGSIASFQYSDALRKSGVKWEADSLDKWLADPASVVPDNDMPFRLEKPEERRAIIAYLKQISAR